MLNITDSFFTNVRRNGRLERVVLQNSGHMEHILIINTGAYTLDFFRSVCSRSKRVTLLLRCLCLFCPRARLRSAELCVRSPSNILFCACYCGSVLLWRRCRTICTPCLVDFCTFTLVMTTNRRREKSVTKSDSRGGGIASHRTLKTDTT